MCSCLLDAGASAGRSRSSARGRCGASFGSSLSGGVRDPAQRADEACRSGSTSVDDSAAPGGSSMNGMNLSGKPGHRAADADAADVRAAADAAHPAALGHVAIDDRAPAPDLHLHLRRVVVGREVAPARSSPRDRSPRGPSCRTATSAGACRRAGSSAPCPPACCSSHRSVSMKLSGWTGQPGTLTIGRPACDAEVPAEIVGEAHRTRSGCRPSRGCPPYVAQVPAATTAHAPCGASSSIHASSVIGCPVCASLPNAVQ